MTTNMTGSPIPERAPAHQDGGWFVLEDGRHTVAGPFATEAEAVADIERWQAELGAEYERVEREARERGEHVSWGPPEEDATTNGQFPPAGDVEAAHSNRRLQRTHRERVEQVAAEHPELRCPHCKPGEVEWFWFESPKWTWGPALCGGAGPMAWCEECHYQAAYLEELLS